MNRVLRVFVRVLAWMASVASVGAVVVGYDALASEIPLTRWTVAPKSLWLAVRIPLINLLTMGLVETLSPALRRATQCGRADTITLVLLVTAAAKAVVETIGIFTSSASSSWSLVSLIAVVCVGTGTAAFLGRELLQPQQWRRLQTTWGEMSLAAALVAGIAALNLPLALRRW